MNYYYKIEFRRWTSECEIKIYKDDFTINKNVIFWKTLFFSSSQKSFAKCVEILENQNYNEIILNIKNEHQNISSLCKTLLKIKQENGKLIKI